MLTKGWDSFQLDPGTCKSKKCRVCDSQMAVNRDIIGPTSFASTMARSKKIHDHFYCELADKEWHQQAKTLLQQAEDTPSHSLAEIFFTDAEKILAMKEPTKDWRRF